MGFEATDPIVVHIHPETGPFSYDPRFNREEWLEEHPDEWTDPDAEVEVDEADSYKKWTVPQLKEELASRELDNEGKKAELVARLEADDAENAS